MAESVRNALLAMVAVTSLHMAHLAYERASQDSPVEGKRTRYKAAQFEDDKCSDHETFRADEDKRTKLSMPMDGLKEMFEFASARGTWGSNCDRPDLGPSEGRETKGPHRRCLPRASFRTIRCRELVRRRRCCQWRRSGRWRSGRIRRLGRCRNV